MCLTCGTRVGLRYSKPPRWQVPAILATLVVVLAVVGVFVALQAATGAGEDEVAAGPASRQEARQDGPDKGESKAPATTDKTETEAKPKKATPKPKPQASPKPDPSDDAGLGAAKRGPTAVLSGVAEPGAAAKVAKRLKRRGFRIGAVTNAPGPAERSAVLYAGGGRAAARALAKEANIRTVKALDRATAGPARGAKLVVVVGGSP